MPKLSVKIEAVTKGLRAGLNEAKGKFKSFSSSIGKFGKSARNIAMGVGGFGVAIGGVIAKIGAMGGQLVQTQLAMETFLGSSEKAKQLIGDLRQFADVTPFDTNSVIQAGRVLAGAGVEAGNTVDVIKMLGDISAGTGKDLNEMAMLYAKSLNKGKVQTRELLQLVNAGVPIIDKLGKSLGKPKEQIFKMAEQGKIKFSDLNKTFKEMTSSGGIYAGLMGKQAQTLLGRWSTLQGKIQNLTADVGGPLQQSLTSITDTFIDWTSQARNASGPIGILLNDLKAISALLEATREGGSFGVKGDVGGFETTAVDTISDSAKGMADVLGPFGYVMSKQIGMAQNLFGIGAEAKGAQAMNTPQSPEVIAYLDRIAQGVEGTNANTTRSGL
ncbi:MAG: tape measure protein [Lentisphaerae bacterium]|nr:tape measure protein [Lentisphaerota bacterium]